MEQKIEQKEFKIKDFTDEELSKIDGIYQIRNILNNHFYIGSAENILRRKKQHIYSLENNKHCNSHLQYAYNLYGEKAFVFEVIKLCKKDILLDIEQTYLNKYFDNSKVCYNENPFASKPSCFKGELNHNYGKPSWNKGLKMSEATKQKLRKPKTIEHKKILSERAKERFKNIENHPMYGKHLSEETKQKLSKNHANFKREKHPKATKVIRLIDCKIYNCMKDCIEDNNISETTLTNHCKNKLKTQRFMYYSDYIKQNIDK